VNSEQQQAGGDGEPEADECEKDQHDHDCSRGANTRQ
jgi:hypothetical protein